MTSATTIGRGFASDNNAGVHPDVLAAIQRANVGHVVAYGDDPFTRAAVGRFHEHFGDGIEVFFVFGGTGANILGLQAMTRPFHSIVCTETAHINVDECGAPEKHAGCKLIDVPTPDGKLTPDLVRPRLHGFGDPHHSQPRVISISQSTELGTVYEVAEVAALAELAHAKGLLLHMDGARIANAAASRGVTLRALTRDAGVDLLSFGGAKNGMMYGEAVVVFDRRLAENLAFLRKQGTQLPSKMRFISAQFSALLADDLWLRNATHANRMAQQLHTALARIPGVTVTQKVQSNAVFAILPREHIAALQRETFFYVWNEETSEVRFMTSFDTTEDDISGFADVVKRVVG
jgi:threonine aldolase